MNPNPSEQLKYMADFLSLELKINPYKILAEKTAEEIEEAFNLRYNSMKDGMLTKKEILMQLFQEMIDSEYREGFESTVKVRVREALLTGRLIREARQTWAKICTEQIEEAFDNDQELIDRYNEAYKISMKDGGFQMPSWGIRGT